MLIAERDVSMKEKLDSEQPYYDYYEPPKTFVKSAIRIINLLEFFYRTRQPAKAIEISRSLELPISSTKYLLSSFVDSGYLSYDPASKEYFPSILFTGLASWLSEIYPSGKVLRAIAREAQQFLGDTIYIAVQHEQYMRTLIIQTEDEHTPTSYDFRVRIPLIGSASGNIALASRSDVELEKLVAQECKKLRPELRSGFNEQILAQIKEIQQRGFATREHAVSVEGTSERYIAVAVRLPVETNAPPMALGFCSLKTSLTQDVETIAKYLNDLIRKYHDQLP